VNPVPLIALWLALGQPPIDLSEWTMEDQFGRSTRLGVHAGNVVVILYGDRGGADANKHLGEQLHVAFHPSARGLPPAKAREAPVRPVPGKERSPDVRLIPAASLGTVPTMLRGLIRAQFRGASPDLPVWLDWQDVLKKQFSLAPGMPNVLILDTKGRVRYTFSGGVDPEKVKELTGVIETLRRE